MAVFVLAGERDEPHRGIPGLRAPIVGRDHELELLGSMLRRVAEEGRGHLVTIYGDPGVGKSRLVAEFTASSDARVIRGRCLPYGDGITFWPLVEIAKAELGLLDTDAAGVALDKVRALGASAPELAAGGARDRPHDRSRRSRLAAARSLSAGGDRRDPRGLAGAVRPDGGRRAGWWP